MEYNENKDNITVYPLAPLPDSANNSEKFCEKFAWKQTHRHYFLQNPQPTIFSNYNSELSIKFHDSSHCQSHWVGKLYSYQKSYYS